MVEQHIQTEFQKILDEYGMEAMIYAFRFEQQITALEERLHSSENVSSKNDLIKTDTDVFISLFGNKEYERLEKRLEEADK